MGGIANPIDVARSDNSFSAKQTFGNEVELDGDINHDGDNVGFYGVAPVERPSAITQTYATAEKTHSNPSQTAVVTTAPTNLTPYGYSQAQATDLIAQLNNARTDILDVKQLINAVIDDLQSQGLLQ